MENIKGDLFMTINELYENISRGGEIEFVYQNKHYSITHSQDGSIFVMEAYNDSSMQTYNKPEEIGEYLICDQKLRDIFENATITFRCF